jgi:hypothetical protein
MTSLLLHNATDLSGIAPPDLSGIEADLANLQRCQDKMERYNRDVEFYLQFGGVEPSAPNC